MNKKDERVIRRDFDLNFDGVNLKAYTETIDGQEVKFLGGTASSTAKDLYGDVIAPSGQVKMLEKLQQLASELAGQNSGLTAWVNHAYKIPEDTLGAFVGASLTTREDGGETFIDLDIKCRVTETNPRALAAWQQVKDGIRHGWSIGAYFLEADWLSDDPESPDYWSLYVTDLNLIEISLVGIPANQRAWCKSAADVKAKAVEAAERITREARDKGESNMGLRQFVQRSIFSVEPETRSADDPAVEHPAPEVPAEEVPAEQEPVQSEAPKTADSTTTSPITASAPEDAPNVQTTVPAESKEATELSVSLREAAGNDPAKLMLAQAADAIDALSKLVTASAQLTKRDPADGEGGTPDDNRDKISLAISHLAKSVGHGLCVRGGGHIAKAIDCLAASVGTQPGEEDPDQLAARAANVDNELVAKSQSLNEASASLEVKKAELATTEASIAAKAAELADAEKKLTDATAQLAELEAKIKAAKEERLGRKSADFVELAAIRNAGVDASSYPKNETERVAAIAKMLQGDGALSGRDMVAGR